MKRSLLAVAAAISLVSATPAAANLLANGGFEVTPCAPGTTSFCSASLGTPLLGWTVTGGSVDFVNQGFWTPAAGRWSLDLDGFSLGSIAQVFLTPTTGAGLFNLAFDLSGNPDGAPGLKLVRIDLAGATFAGGGTSRVVGYDLGANTRSNMNWQGWEFSFVAGLGAPVTVSFTSLSNLLSPGPYFFGAALDNVAVTQVPEPGTYAMLLAGLAAIGLIARRRLRG
jgi:hypothetical protein